MSKLYKKVVTPLFIVVALLLSTLNAHAALSKGDLAVIGMNGDSILPLIYTALPL